MNPQEQAFTIQQLSLKLDIPKSTLRFWENELNGIIVPHRTRGGQRRYTIEHLSILKEIKQLRGSGISLAEIKRELGKAQMSETGLRPIGAYAPVGSQKSGDDQTDRIDSLTNRIAEVVKREIYSFLEQKEE